MHIGQAAKVHCARIAQFSDEIGVITRTFLSPAMRDSLAYLEAWADRLGMASRIDDAGNFRALLKGTGKRRLVIGSHLDSVPHAGAYDGVLGVVMGMLIAESLQGALPLCSLEIVGFSEEEGVRFKRPFIGSTAFVAGLDEEFASLADANDITVIRAIQNFGLNAASIHKPQMEEADAYLEFHIEQGPVLESLNLGVGIVDAIAGQTRATFEFTGHANHAGTTPMNLRHDAFCAAAEWTLMAEKKGRITQGLVATVGSVQVSPGAINIIPGAATLSLDLRHAEDSIRLTALEDLVREANRIADQRSVKVQSTVRLNQTAVPMDTGLLAQLEKVLPNAPRMTSGAGHDAMILAPKIPSAMIFVRSPGGISHHPDEDVLEEDIEAAFQAGRTFVQNFS